MSVRFRPGVPISMNESPDFLKLVTPELEKMSTALPKKKKTVVAYFNGKPIRTSSGKCAWNDVGPAKNAMILHFGVLEDLFACKGIPAGDSRRWNSASRDYTPYPEKQKRREIFRQRLWTLIEFREI